MGVLPQVLLNGVASVGMYLRYNLPYSELLTGFDSCTMVGVEGGKGAYSA